MEGIDIKVNKYQSHLNEELKETLPKEVWDDILEYVTNVKFISNLISPDRKYIKDVPVMTYVNKDGEIIEYEDGRKEINLTDPHILEDMDFFRERAIFFRKNGKYTNITPNGNPKSDYAQFWREELRRWKDGLVRDDGEWIPGELYFYWNYSPIPLVEDDKFSRSGKKGERVRDFPRPWLGDYLFFHYISQARELGQHGKLLKTRGVGFSLKTAAWSPRNMYVFPGSHNPNFHLASEKSFLSGDKGIWGKILDVLDWIGENTPLPRMRLVDKKQAMEVQLGYEDEYGTRKGLLSSAFGISLKDNPDKARGVRGPLIHYEEDGLFPNLEKAWGVNRKAVEDGGVAFGFMLAGGTGGVEGKSFDGSEKLFYNPRAYNIYSIPNVYDKSTDGETGCGFFWGAYMNRHNCYNVDNGEPDVIKALVEICLDRYEVKYNSSDVSAITQKKAEEPITPQEAIMRTEGTIFPVADLKSHLESIAIQKDRFLAEHLVGDLVYNGDGSLAFRHTVDKFPLRSYEITVADKSGCLEIFEMPKKNAEGIITRGRYIAGIDPIDADRGQSLFSILVMDTFTDRIVAEYSGRPRTANEAYDIALRTLKYYNAEANYESNLKGLFSYFDQRNALHYLANNPQILKDMELTKATNVYGNLAHPYSETVYTPQGIKKWGDIKIGDELFNSYGGVTNVIDIPFNNITDIYEITLKDGRKVKASENHLWDVIDWNGYNKVLSTIDILNNYYRFKGKYKEFKYYIPSNEGVKFKSQKLELEPYVLGLLLGDGSPSNATLNQVGFTSNLEDLEEYKRFINYNFKTYDDRHHRMVIPNIKNILKDLNLQEVRCRTKFIPDIYKYNSSECRLELLKGLMDTDGTVSKYGVPSFCTTSFKLADDITWLARSLGINATKHNYKNKFGDVFKISFYTDKLIFKLERKYNKQRITKTQHLKTAIVNIQKLNTEMSKCVTVDSKDSCYLINEFIKTHNSKGTHANARINSWGRQLQADWMLSPVNPYADEEDDDYGKIKLHTLRGLAYIEECIKWNSDGNFDRVSAAGMLFILREDRYKRIESAKLNRDKPRVTLADDSFFNKNFKSSIKVPNSNFNTFEIN